MGEEKKNTEREKEREGKKRSTCSGILLRAFE